MPEGPHHKNLTKANNECCGVIPQHAVCSSPLLPLALATPPKTDPRVYRQLINLQSPSGLQTVGKLAKPQE